LVPIDRRQVLWAGFFVAVFAIATIVPHELGHALVARVVSWKCIAAHDWPRADVDEMAPVRVLFDLRLIPAAGQLDHAEGLRGFRWKRF
jgi:hypothetical protein